MILDFLDRSRAVGNSNVANALVNYREQFGHEPGLLNQHRIVPRARVSGVVHEVGIERGKPAVQILALILQSRAEIAGRGRPGMFVLGHA
jgi:hypothetical protein